MAQYIYFLPNSKNLSATTSSTSFMLNYYLNSGVTSTPISAETNADWVNIRQIDEGNKSIQVEVAQNTEGVERTAVISIVTKVLEEGNAYYTVDYDITTIRQSGPNAGSGSIIPNYTSFTPKAEGDNGIVTFTTTNVIQSSIGISCDQPYVSIDYLTNENHIKTGFTWSVPENSGPSARQFTITISAKRSNGSDYAYAYVSGVQPSINNVGWIKFEHDTIRASATTTTSSVNFETEFVSNISSAFTEDYWLHVDFINIESGQSEDRWEGTIDYTIDENQYNIGRQGKITMYGISDVDGSLVQTDLHFSQGANATGGPQQGYIYCNNPIVYMPTPDATHGHFELSYNAFLNRGTVSATTNGNILGTPVFSADHTILTFNVNSGRSTTDYTLSQIFVSGQDTSGRTIPPIVLTVLQPPYVEYVEFPIWQDTDLTIPTEMEYLLYRLTINDNIIYSGRAFALNGQATIRLNEIMQQVLLPTIDLESEGLQDNNAYANAVLEVSFDGVEYQRYKQIRAYADWSYSDEKNNILSDPIKKVLDRRQLFLCTAMDYAGDGPTVVVTSYESGGSGVENVYSLINNIGTVVQGIAGADKIYVEAGEAELEYKVIDGCERYCLYYLNAKGGYDSFIFNKTSKEKDDFERLTYKRNIDNKHPMHATVEYKTKVKKSWTLNTGFLTDSQSLNFAENLVGTPLAFLHDLEKDKIYPVSVKTNTVDYQTFVRNGRKFCKYGIVVELAQDRFRS